MIKTCISKLAEDIGFDIATSDNETQANLLNGFCNGLAVSMKSDQLQTQICYMVKGFSKQTRDVLKEINEYIILSERNEL